MSCCLRLTKVPQILPVSNCVKHLILPKTNAGFTLIELIIVIIILGIMSVTVAPKFFTSNGFSEYAYRTDVVAKLRLIQTKAMQQTPFGLANVCHSVLVTTNKLGQPDNCTAPFSFANDSLANSEQKMSTTTVKVDINDNIEFSINAESNSLTFDSMGRPSLCVENEIPATCTITITGEQALVVLIETEGYIHAM